MLASNFEYAHRPWLSFLLVHPPRNRAAHRRNVPARRCLSSTRRALSSITASASQQRPPAATTISWTPAPSSGERDRLGPVLRRVRGTPADSAMGIHRRGAKAGFRGRPAARRAKNWVGKDSSADRRIAHALNPHPCAPSTHIRAPLGTPQTPQTETRRCAFIVVSFARRRPGQAASDYHWPVWAEHRWLWPPQHGREELVRRKFAGLGQGGNTLYGRRDSAGGFLVAVGHCLFGLAAGGASLLQDADVGRGGPRAEGRCFDARGAGAPMAKLIIVARLTACIGGGGAVVCVQEPLRWRRDS